MSRNVCLDLGIYPTGWRPVNSKQGCFEGNTKEKWNRFLLGELTIRPSKMFLSQKFQITRQRSEPKTFFNRYEDEGEKKSETEKMINYSYTDFRLFSQYSTITVHFCKQRDSCYFGRHIKFKILLLNKIS